MADVKVPAKLHLMSKAAQKAWYKKNNMAMPDDAGGRSAAAAKKVKVAPRKEIAVEPGSVRALNAARQQAYMAKGGRQPIGAMGSGGSNVMAGGGQSTIKDLKASIKAGFNPKVSLDPYESEKAKKVGPRSLKLKKESADLQEVTKTEAESMLGGPVKEKPKMPPGKQPAGYRYVRALARKAMKKGMKEEVEVLEAVKDVADVGEYDYEGDMAKSQLRSIMANSKRMHDMLEENTNLPEWVQSKITLAEDYISTAANYMEGEMNEELIHQEESIFEAMKKMKMDDEDEMEDDEDDMEDDEEETKMNGKKKKMEEGYMGFKKLKASIAVKGSARDPAAVAAAIGRKKYGKEKFQAMAAAGKKANEETEVVVEAEGKVAVTPQEKTLAAHHGDKTKITYGDVIKARIKSAKEKALKGKE